MNDARRGKLDAVLVWKLDRFGRSALDVLANIRDLDAAGVRFIATTQGIDIRPGVKAGLRVDAHVVPDISIGQAWAVYWKAKGLAEKYGSREKHENNYPEYFPQAKSNPQDVNIYPLEALGDFRRWMQSEYIPQRFPKYIKAKVADGLLPPSAAELLLAKALPPAPKKLN